MPETCTDFPSSDEVHWPQLFEPALKHIARAFRQGDPTFRDPAVEQRWRVARRVVTSEILRRITAPPALQRQLALRGSVLLRSWLPDAAREPGDLDFVARPATMTMDSAEGRRLIADLRAALPRPIEEQGLQVLTDELRLDDIWTYERAPGRRIVIPWRAAGLPPGSVQIDVVFGEALPPEHVALQELRLPDGSRHAVSAASRELSLAWKLMWLLSDSYPQGKDLYDAVLLAESTPLASDLLHAALWRGDAWWRNRPVTLAHVDELEIDWSDIQQEYRWIAGSAGDWKQRLVTALRPALQTGPTS